MAATTAIAEFKCAGTKTLPNARLSQTSEGTKTYGERCRKPTAVYERFRCTEFCERYGILRYSHLEADGGTSIIIFVGEQSVRILAGL